MLDRDYDISAEACEQVIDVVRQNVPFVAVDLPHGWSAWSKRVCCRPTKSSSPPFRSREPRNAKNIVDLSKASRKNDAQTASHSEHGKLPKRQEITPRNSSRRSMPRLLAVIDFDCETFSQAANNGQMVGELNAKAKAVEMFHDIAQADAAVRK